MRQKHCSRCRKILPATKQYFTKHSLGKYGLSPECKECNKKERKTNAHKRILYMRKYRQGNAAFWAKRREYSKIYNKRSNRRKWRKEYDHRRWLEHKDKINKSRMKRYYQNINFRIKAVLSARINSALNGRVRSDRTVSMLGCSIEKLKQYLSRQFLPKMSWGNYGQWHIDHIRPCSSFDLSNPDEQKKCFHYTNLQPLWAEDNYTKGGT